MPPRKTRQASTAKAENGPVVKLPSRRKVPATKDDSDSEDPVPSSTKSSKKKVAKKDLVSSKNLESASNGDHEGNGIRSDPRPTSLPVNILKRLDMLQYGLKQDRCLQIKSIKDHFVKKSISHLSGADYAGRFTRRITSLTWHEKYPYVLASASKFGDIMLITGKSSFNSDSPFDMDFETKAESQGGGAGYSVTAMKFHNEQMNILYRASIDCTVARVDLVHGEKTEFFNTGDYNRWFCGMDVSFSRNMILAGDNKGTGYKFSLDGKLVNLWRLHKNKIHHIEFSKKDPNLLVTSSLDKAEAVRIWDARFLKTSAKETSVQPLQSLSHACGLNCAKFSPLDGSRLLTSDQHDEIRVYQGPLWQDYLTIKHHHKQFQHITPVKADWHPVNDYIVIGRYPRAASESSKKLARAIQFFDSYSGELVDMIYPPLNEICSLNVFNTTGEYLATGMNSKLILWKPAMSLEVGENSKPKEGDASTAISEKMRNALRGRRAREYSPESDDDEEGDSSNQKKKRSKTSTASTNSASTVAKSKAPAKPRKK